MEEEEEEEVEEAVNAKKRQSRDALEEKKHKINAKVFSVVSFSHSASKAIKTHRAAHSLGLTIQKNPQLYNP